MRTKRGSIRWYSDGHVETLAGRPVMRHIVYRGRKYSLMAATGAKSEADRSARGWRRQFGGAIVRRLEPGNFGVYATV